MLNYSNIKKTSQKSVILQTFLYLIWPPHLLFLVAFPCSYMYWARLYLCPCLVPSCCASCIALSLLTLLSCGLPSCSTLYPHLCFHPCSPSQTSSAVLLTSHCILFYHMWLQRPPSSLSFPNLKLSSHTFPYYSIYSCHLSPSALFSLPSPSLALVSAPITFSEDLKPTHLCVDAEAVCLSLFYSIIHFSF